MRRALNRPKRRFPARAVYGCVFMDEATRDLVKAFRQQLSHDVSEVKAEYGVQHEHVERLQGLQGRAATKVRAISLSHL